MPVLSPLSRTILRSLLRFTRRPLPAVLHIDGPREGAPALPLPEGIDKVVSSKALRGIILYCFRASPDTPASNDTGLYYVRRLLRAQELAEQIQVKVAEKAQLSSIYKKTFEVGDVVMHRSHGLRALVTGWDIDPQNGNQKLKLLFDANDANPRGVIKRKRSSRREEEGQRQDWLQSWRLADNYSLVTDPLLQRVINHSIREHFSRFDPASGRFVPNEGKQMRYPEDIKHVSMYALDGDLSCEVSDPEGLQRRMDAAVKNTRRATASIHAKIDEILSRTITDILDAAVEVESSPGSIEPGSALSALLYIDATCHSLDTWKQFSNENGVAGSWQLRKRFRQIFVDIAARRSNRDDSNTAAEEAKEATEGRRSSQLQATERELKKELRDYERIHNEPPMGTDCCIDLFDIHNIYGAVFDCSVRRHPRRSELVTSLKQEKQIADNVTNKFKVLEDELDTLITSSKSSSGAVLLPGDIVFSQQEEKYFVCVERDRRGVFRLQRPSPSRAPGDSVWMLLPLFLDENNEDPEVEFLAPPGTVAINAASSDGPEVHMALEHDLELRTDVQLNGLYGSRVNPQVFELFSTFDKKKSCFVPYLDALIKHGERVSNPESTVRNYDVCRRPLDVKFFATGLDLYEPVNGNVKVLSSRLSQEDDMAGNVVLEVLSCLHEAICMVKMDIENIETLKKSIFKSELKKKKPTRMSTPGNPQGQAALRLSDLHVLLRNAATLIDSVRVRYFVMQLEHVHPSHAVTILYDEADTLLKFGYIKDASRIYDSLLRTDDTCWSARVGKVVTQDLDSAHRALGGLGVVLASRPDTFDNWTSAGTLHYYNGKVQDAIGCMQRSLLLNPWNGETQAALLALELEAKVIAEAKVRKGRGEIIEGAESCDDSVSSEESNDGSVDGDWADRTNKKSE